MTKIRAMSQTLASDNATHPLVESMRHAAALNPLFYLPIREPGQDCWIDATDLFPSDRERLYALVMAYGKSTWGTTNPHAAGSAFIIAYLSRLIGPVIAQYVIARRVPQVSLNNIAFHQVGDMVDATALNSPSFAALLNDPAAGHPDAELVSDNAALHSKLKEWLFDSNLKEVIDALHQQVRASIKVSWNDVADSCALGFSRLYDVVKEPDRVVRDAGSFFGDASSPVYRQVAIEVFFHQGKQGFFSRRAGCCLEWRGSKKYCSNCILLSREEQDEKFRKRLEARR